MLAARCRQGQGNVKGEPFAPESPTANLPRPDFCQSKIQEKSADQSKMKYGFLHLMYSNFLRADLMGVRSRIAALSSPAVCVLGRFSCQKAKQSLSTEHLRATRVSTHATRGSASLPQKRGGSSRKGGEPNQRPKMHTEFFYLT